MTNEERVRVDRLERYLITDRGKTYTTIRVNDLETALSLIKEQQENIEKYEKIYKEYDCYRWVKELDKKDKIIDLMAEFIATLDIEEDICANIENDNCNKMAFGECENCIKQYFADKAKTEQ